MRSRVVRASGSLSLRLSTRATKIGLVPLMELQGVALLKQLQAKAGAANPGAANQRIARRKRAEGTSAGVAVSLVLPCIFIAFH